MLLAGRGPGVGGTVGTPAAAAGPSVSGGRLGHGGLQLLLRRGRRGGGVVGLLPVGRRPGVPHAWSARAAWRACPRRCRCSQAWRGRLPKLVVIGAGYNDWSIGPNIDAIMQEATARGLHAVVWLTYQDVTSASHSRGEQCGDRRRPPGDGRSLGWASGTPSAKARPRGSTRTACTSVGPAQTAYGQLIKASLDAVPPAVDPRCNPATATGNPAPPLANLAPNPPSTGSRITPVTPARLVDTRPGVPDDERGCSHRGSARARRGRRRTRRRAGRRNGRGPQRHGRRTVRRRLRHRVPSRHTEPTLASNSNYRAFQNVAGLGDQRLGVGGAVEHLHLRLRPTSSWTSSATSTPLRASSSTP